MAKARKLTVLTANDLVEGHSVYLGREGWETDIARAMVAMTPEQAGEFEALGARFEEENRIVGPYLVEVAVEEGAIVPVTRRERIRAAGIPTVPVGPRSEPARAA